MALTLIGCVLAISMVVFQRRYAHRLFVHFSLCSSDKICVLKN
jgi:hypothetical protein